MFLAWSLAARFVGGESAEELMAAVIVASLSLIVPLQDKNKIVGQLWRPTAPISGRSSIQLATTCT
jgi:hypothetical protein